MLEMCQIVAVSWAGLYFAKTGLQTMNKREHIHLGTQEFSATLIPSNSVV
jgi:hypothetical protein